MVVLRYQGPEQRLKEEVKVSIYNRQQRMVTHSQDGHRCWPRRPEQCVLAESSPEPSRKLLHLFWSSPLLRLPRTEGTVALWPLSCSHLLSTHSMVIS